MNYDPATGQPQPDASHTPFVGSPYTWQPSDSPADPHDDDYTVTHGPAVTGPIPGNIHTGGPAPFSRMQTVTNDLGAPASGWSESG